MIARCHASTLAPAPRHRCVRIHVGVLRMRGARRPLRLRRQPDASRRQRPCRRGGLRRMPRRRARGVVALQSSSRDAGRRCEIGARRFSQCALQLCGHDVGLLDARRQVFRSHRRAGRKARRLRDQVHVRRRAAAAVPDRASRRPAAGPGNRLGCASQGARRPALVPSLSGTQFARRRSAALDRRQPELELHVRRVSFDAAPQELRRSDGSLRHDAGRRSTLPAKPVTARAPSMSRERAPSATASRIRPPTAVCRSR